VNSQKIFLWRMGCGDNVRRPRVVSLQRPGGTLLEQQGSFGLDIGCLAKLFSPFEFSST